MRAALSLVTMATVIWGSGCPASSPQAPVGGQGEQGGSGTRRGGPGSTAGGSALHRDAAPVTGQLPTALRRRRRDDGPAPPAARRSTGVPECDEFLNRYEDCVRQRFPDAAFRATAEQHLDQLRASWRTQAADPSARPSLASACVAMADAAKKALAGLGCSW